RVDGAASAAQHPRPLRMRAHLPRTGLCGSPLLETEVSGVAGRRAARIRRRGVIMLNVWAASRKAHALVNRLRREHPNATEFEFMEAFYTTVSEDETMQGLEYPQGHVTEDWLCIDCGINTAPGVPDGLTALREIEATGASEMTIGPDTEMYMVRDAVWKKAGMEPFGGCLCIGCL